MLRHRFRENRGQAIVEMSVVLVILLLLLFFMITAGFYIYDQIIFTFAANKALDRGVALLSRNDAEITDSISGNELKNDEVLEIKNILLQSANVKIFSPEMPEIIVTTTEYDKSVELEMDMTAKYECTLPLLAKAFPDISIKLKYLHYKSDSGD